MSAIHIRSAIAALALVPALSLSRPAPAPRVVTITAREYAFEGPGTIAAGTVTLRLVNRGVELHHVILFKLTQGKTFADLAALMKEPPQGPPPAWLVDVGGPNAPVPGRTADATVTLDAGTYVLMCFIPSPGKDGKEGMPHVMKGMVKQLTVTGAARAAEPKADATIRLADYGFTLSAPLTAGRHTIRIDNTASQTHEMFVAELAPGKSAHDLVAWVGTGMAGAPPATPMGGVTNVGAGAHIFTTLDLKPGRYALVCFLPDARDGQPHVAHGMVQEIEVAGRTASR